MPDILTIHRVAVGTGWPRAEGGLARVAVGPSLDPDTAAVGFRAMDQGVLWRIEVGFGRHHAMLAGAVTRFE